MGMRGYLNRRIPADETILYRAHISWVPFFVSLTRWGAVFSAIGGVAWGVTGSMGTGLAAVMFGIVLGFLFQMRFITYALGVDIVVTDRHLHCKTGIVRIDNDREASLGRVDRVDIDMHTITQRLFDYGDIEFQTVGSDGFFDFNKVASPYALKMAFDDAKEAYDSRAASNGYRDSYEYEAPARPMGEGRHGRRNDRRRW